MELQTQLAYLSDMHARLQWDDIIPATAAVLSKGNELPRATLTCETLDLPLFAGSILQITIDWSDIAKTAIDRIQRTYDSARLVELSGIALAGLTIYHAGGHEIRDIAYRGSSADYLVDDTFNRLEVAARSRKGDMETAWRQREQRLRESGSEYFYLFVCELETMTARLGYLQGSYGN